jgi:hypothetical protein
MKHGSTISILKQKKSKHVLETTILAAYEEILNGFYRWQDHSLCVLG